MLLWSLLIVLVSSIAVDCALEKEFDVTWYDGRNQSFTYPKTDYGACVYDSSEDLLRCMRNYKYQDMIQTWKYDPEVIRYVSVRCTEQRYYPDHQNVCLCKNGSHAAHPSRQRQHDAYIFCHVTRLTRYMLSSLSKAEVIDLSANMISFIHGNAFDKCVSMKYLNLGNNPIKDLPAAMLCDTHALQILLLRNLQLSSFPLHIFDCYGDSSNVTLLDLSNGLISHIEGHSLKHLQRLISLNLSNNLIENIAVNSFAGGNSLRHLDVSRNRLSDLPAGLCEVLPNIQYLDASYNVFRKINLTEFNNCKNLDSLDFSRNQIGTLEGTFSSGHNLRELILSSNLLLEIPTNSFVNVSGLRRLDLSRNSLSRLPYGLLSNLNELEFLNLSKNELILKDDNRSTPFNFSQNLQYIDLSHNQIQMLNMGMFSDCSNLKTLDVSHNVINVLEPFSTYNITSLEILNLSSNKIISVPERFLESLTSLHTLDLSNNAILKFDGIRIPTSLRVISLEENNILDFPDSFTGSMITRLFLKGNNITSLPSARPLGIESVQILDLSCNRISSIEKNVFATASNLLNLNLENNGLTLDFSKDVFKGANNLTYLNIATNKVTSAAKMFDFTTLWNLKEINISKNPITVLEKLISNYNLGNGTGISIERISLSDCNITQISATFKGLQKLKFVDLTGNQIKTFSPFNSNFNTVFYLLENPIQCSCNMSWLTKEYVSVDGRKLPTHAYKIKYCKIYPKGLLMDPRKVSENHYLCLQNDSCDSFTCCSTYGYASGSSELALCGPDLRNFPWHASKIARVVYLDNNRFGHLSGPYEASLKMKAEELYLNSSGITAMDPSFFQIFPELLNVYLNNNKIKRLFASQFLHQTKLQVLNISYNEINVIEINAFSGLLNLNILDLSHNNLHHVDPRIFSPLEGLGYRIRYYLGYNPWECDCFNFAFKDWVLGFRGRIHDRMEVKCADGRKQVQHALIRVCENNSEEDSLNKKEIIVVIVVMTIVISLLVSACFYYRRDLVAILYNVTGIGCFRRRNYGNKLNDVYLCYDMDDSKCSQWINLELLPKLKHRKNRLKVVVRDRTNLNASITNPESDSMFTCKCFLFVVSRNIHSDDICTDEFRKAYSHSMINPMYKVILLIYGNLDMLSLQPEVRKLMSTGNYITARSRTVWSRLRYELPDPHPFDQSDRTDDDASDTDVVLYSASGDYQYVTLH